MIGDSGYPLLPFLMNVILDDGLAFDKAIYNQVVRSTRQLAERTIGVLKIRFRCILGERKLRYHPTRARRIIYACATLHNYLILNGFDIMHDIDDDYLQFHINNNRDGNNNNNNNQANRDGGVDRRNVLINYFANHPPP